jgi:hypothetical protein
MKNQRCLSRERNDDPLFSFNMDHPAPSTRREPWRSWGELSRFGGSPEIFRKVVGSDAARHRGKSAGEASEWIDFVFLKTLERFTVWSKKFLFGAVAIGVGELCHPSRFLEFCATVNWRTKNLEARCYNAYHEIWISLSMRTSDSDPRSTRTI